MRMYDIIKRKRDGYELSDEEIRFFIFGCVSGKVPDYQISALLMAIYFKGMTESETLSLTFAIRDSGEIVDLSRINGIRADKHSTGGVGDKTSPIVMPIVASLGVKVAKMSGRALGHTGGTIDKLEAIEGFNANLNIERFINTVNKVGLSIIGQGDIAPADKILYALRDVTATVDSLPLIASSIMGKKLAVDDDCIVLDVKTGSGAFMKTQEEAEKLAEMCVKIGKKAGKQISALITDMSEPLGNSIGNSLEIVEAIDVLKGKGPSDLRELSIELAAEILRLAGKGDLDKCKKEAVDAITSGRALNAFAAMVEEQGGNKKWIYDTTLFPVAKYSYEVCAQQSGYINKIDAEGFGTASLLLGAGRNTLKEDIDYSAGIVLSRKKGDFVNKGDVIATLYSNKNDFMSAGEKVIASTAIGEIKQTKKPKVIARILGEI